MKMTAKQIAEKASNEPAFLVGLLDNVDHTLSSFNIEVEPQEQAEVDAAMTPCRDFISQKLGELGAEAEGEVKGYGGLCCNF